MMDTSSAHKTGKHGGNGARDTWFKLNNSEIKYPVESFQKMSLIENLNSMTPLQYNDDFIEYDADDEAQ